MSIILLPDPALVLLIGSSGAGKSTFAARHFAPTEIISSDRCRALVGDDENAQAVNAEAFSLAHHWARLRLQLGKLTVIDATNLQTHARRPFLRMTRAAHLPCVALVLRHSLATCTQQNLRRTERIVPAQVLAQHARELAQTLARLPHEGYQAIHLLDEAGSRAVRIERV